MPRLPSDPQDVAVTIPDRICTVAAETAWSLTGGIQHCVVFCVSSVLLCWILPNFLWDFFAEGSGWNNVDFLPRYLVYTGYPFPGGDFQSVPGIRAELFSLPSW